MKTIISGGRDYQLTEDDYYRLAEINITEVVSGCARGADIGGELYATNMKLPIKRFPADWGRHHVAAGPIRNKAMAEYADACVVFPGGKGTDNMFEQATKKGLIVFDWRNKPNPQPELF
jgi:hypothetical protein